MRSRPRESTRPEPFSSLPSEIDMSAVRSASRLAALGRRWALAGLILPGLLLTNLLCFCVHGAGSTAAVSEPAGHCHADGQGLEVPVPHSSEEGATCPHCRGDGALLSSARALSDGLLHLVSAALIVPLAFTEPVAVEMPIWTANILLAPPPLFARNRILLI